MTNFKKYKEEYFEGCRNVLHIGGHAGQEAPLYKNVGVSFVFVEPIPRLARMIQKAGHVVLPVAISNFRGIASLNVAKVTERSSLLDAPKEVMTVSKKIPVAVLQLSDICAPFDGLSIDTQGSTYDILSSASKKDLRHFNIIVCEVSENPRYNGERSRKDVADLLTGAGFEEIAFYKHKTLDIFDIVWKKKK